MTTTTVRFAPSPTGKLHVGNIRTALMNWLFAKKQSETGAGEGRFMLRLDDTDAARSTEEFAESIRNDLLWLGLTWDFEARQSERFERYGAVVDQLKLSGRLYACYETPEELDLKRKRQLGRGLPPVYDRSALSLTDTEKSIHEKEGRTSHWRFCLEERDVCWEDLIRGRQHIDARSLSDPILIRGDGSYLYTLPSVVDDIDFAITHVIRGEDHVANSAAQIQIFEALGAAPPLFAHHNLLVGKDGQALSKRFGALSIRHFRDQGLEPLAVAAHAATIGTSDPVRPFPNLQEIAENFKFSKFSRAPARFDEDELAALNARLLHELPYDLAKPKLEALGVPPSEAFWSAIAGNLERIVDAKIWWDVVYGEIAPVIEDQAFCQQAEKHLPPEPWGEEIWKTWTDCLKVETGVKGRALFHPIRLALTGREKGPELKRLLPLMGRARVASRLLGG